MIVAVAWFVEGFIYKNVEEWNRDKGLHLVFQEFFDDKLIITRESIEEEKKTKSDELKGKFLDFDKRVFQ